MLSTLLSPKHLDNHCIGKLNFLVVINNMGSVSNQGVFSKNKFWEKFAHYWFYSFCISLFPSISVVSIFQRIKIVFCTNNLYSCRKRPARLFIPH